jgi:ABC-type Fe3+/spermidine/putrescine transport system ATPase subunit
VSLTLQGVEKRYPEFTIRLDLEVRPGELLTLLGPSGCGKTTSLRLVAGFLQPEAGSIRIDGRSVEGEPPHRRGIGIVFQDYALFPNLNVLDNVCFGPVVQGWERGRARVRGRQLLELVHLGGYERRRVHTLSGGERQRVALARALAPRPRLLLLDEPLSALDAKLRLVLRREIQGVQRELGVTTVYVTHDQEEALAISDRIAVMRGGRIEQVGTPEEIYRRPASLFVAGFIGQANLVAGTVAGRDGGLFELDTPLGRFRGRADGKPPAPGERRVLFFRPEAVLPAGGPPPGSQPSGSPPAEGPPSPGGRGIGVRGRVVRCEFLGTQVQIEVDASGQRLIVALPETERLPPGSEIAFSVDPGRCRLLPPEDGEPGGANSPGS